VSTIAGVIDHVGVNVRDFAASRRFYEHALEPLGYHVLIAFDEWNSAGFGQEDKPVFWIAQREPLGTGTHVAFSSPDRATVDRFYAAALEAGGTDNGPPGLREHYHSTYYSAFVLDPDGNNVEAVCHRAE
jgi:catechol 2,3-dioxygenase-like lactoylglutathione lyase family enzyme